MEAHILLGWASYSLHPRLVQETGVTVTHTHSSISDKLPHLAQQKVHLRVSRSALIRLKK